jgi:hypothetical protein
MRFTMVYSSTKKKKITAITSITKKIRKLITIDKICTDKLF